MHTTPLALSALTLLACFSPRSAAPPGGSAPPREPAPHAAARELPAVLAAPEEGLVLEVGPDADGGPTLLELLRRYQEVWGVEFVVDAESGQILRNAQCGLVRTVEVPAESVHGFVHAVLRANGIAISPLRLEAPAVFLVTSLDTGRRSLLRANVQPVAFEDLEAWAPFSATLVETVVPLEHLDARQAANTLRTLVVDPNTLTFVPASSHVIVVQAFAPDALRIARMLAAIDRLEPEPIAETEEED